MQKETHKSGRWPEATVKKCCEELALGKAVGEIEKMYGVPQGTLYRWKEKRQAEGTRAEEKQAQAALEKKIAHSAARGALAAVKLMERRIARSAVTERRREQLRAQLEKTPEGAARKTLEKRLKEMEKPVSDSSLTTMFKALAEKSAPEHAGAPVRVEVLLNRNAEEYAG